MKKTFQKPGASKGGGAMVRILVILALFFALLEWITSFGRRANEHRENAAQLEQAETQVKGEVRQILKSTNPEDGVAGLQAMGQTYDAAADRSSG